MNYFAHFHLSIPGSNISKVFCSRYTHYLHKHIECVSCLPCMCLFLLVTPIRLHHFIVFYVRTCFRCSSSSVCELNESKMQLVNWKLNSLVQVYHFEQHSNTILNGISWYSTIHMLVSYHLHHRTPNQFNIVCNVW